MTVGLRKILKKVSSELVFRGHYGEVLGEESPENVLFPA